jgi:hypothetical protein
MIEAVRLTFAALGDTHPEGAIAGLRVSTIEDAQSDLQLGLDGDGRQHLLVAADVGDMIDPGITTITASSRDLTIGGVTARHIDIVCEVSELSEVFDYFIAAVLERAHAQPGDPVALVATVLDRWHSFFTPAGPPPSRETLTGVLAELLLLRDVAARESSEVLAIWAGPGGGRHDIRRGRHAVEVKSTRSHTARAVTIHGEDQLLAPAGGTLHLHLVRLEEVAGLGICLTDLIDDIVGLGVARLQLLDAVATAGIPANSLNEIGRVRFDLRERLTYPVDDHMPRIIPETFASGQKPTGVLDVTYRIDLDHIADHHLAPEAYEGLIGLLTASGGDA